MSIFGRAADACLPLACMQAGASTQCKTCLTPAATQKTCAVLFAVSGGHADDIWCLSCAPERVKSKHVQSLNQAQRSFPETTSHLPCPLAFGHRNNHNRRVCVTEYIVQCYAVTGASEPCLDTGCRRAAQLRKCARRVPLLSCTWNVRQLTLQIWMMTN